VVNLYSDLLLHEILAEGTRGIVGGDAGEREFRTALLWGLSQTVPYFHSGAADTIEESIMLYDGESAKVRQAFVELSDADKFNLPAFLNSL
jgi:CxxC motif-containing protein (DUF1111 family)